MKRRQWRINKTNLKYCMPQISLLQQTSTLGDNILLYMKNSLPQNYYLLHIVVNFFLVEAETRRRWDIFQAEVTLY